MTIIGIICFAALIALCVWIAVRADRRAQDRRREDFEAYGRELERWEKEREEREGRGRE